MKLTRISLLFICFCFQYPFSVSADDGYRVWLRYERVKDPKLLQEYSGHIQLIASETGSPAMKAAQEELKEGLSSLLNKNISIQSSPGQNGTILIGTPNNNKTIASLHLESVLKPLGEEGFLIREIKNGIVITANTDIGVLYGTFHFLKLIQTGQSLKNISVTEKPTFKHRILNHWDNLDHTVERGYAGESLWRWHELPEYKSPRYKDYARINASIGINGTVLNNVNTNAQILTEEYLKKVKALADVFRPYGIKVYLTARFSAPIEIGGLKTADPLDPQVISWWNTKVKEIYEYVPDFGGFLVKANSEGQPGPQDYKRTHADGANVLANALKPYGGIVMWRAFVYGNKQTDDRVKQAYDEFMPFDGQFENNILIQTKNGPLDFQPREAVHPLFGAMKKTPLMMEFQITQEYLGHSIHLVYLAPLYKECLDTDTYAKGKGSYVSKVIDGSLYDQSLTGIAGVSNIGSDRNWCGHPFGQANWYAFGRLAWNPSLTSEEIAKEWINMTFSCDPEIVNTVLPIMMQSREAAVNYMTPLGLHHIMDGNHYGPGPWISNKKPEIAHWTSVYYHKADSNGIGFNRIKSGSNALEQYFPPVRAKFEKAETCPEELLLWFHHIGWDYKLQSGKTLWDEMCQHYNLGVQQVKDMQNKWRELEGKIDKNRFEHVNSLLNIQLKDAKFWRDACILYFQTFSKKPIPEGIEKPEKPLEYFINYKYPYLPGG